MHFSSIPLVENSPVSILNIEAVSFSETLVPIYQTTRRHIPQFSKLPENHISFFLILVLGKGIFTAAVPSVSVISCFVYCSSHVLFPAISPQISQPHFKGLTSFSNRKEALLSTIRQWRLLEVSDG
jgi:hypothetical protein